jgi:hypothetical protein
MAFLLEQFRGTGLKDPTESSHGLDNKATARDFAARYRQEKRAAKELRQEVRAPRVHHPVFKGKPVNHDPRERFIADHLTRHGRYNVFHAS